VLGVPGEGLFTTVAPTKRLREFSAEAPRSSATSTKLRGYPDVLGVPPYCDAILRFIMRWRGQEQGCKTPGVMRSPHAGMLIALCVPAFACKDAATQLIVAVDSDLPVPAALTSVEVSSQVEGRAPVVATFDVTPPPRSACSATACRLPLSIGVSPSTGDPNEMVTIMVRGDGPSGQLVTRRVRTGFVNGKSLALPVFLASSCAGMACDEGSTCDRGTCVAESVDPRMLAEAPENLEPGRLFPSRGSDAATQVADSATTDAKAPFEDARPSVDAGAGGGEDARTSVDAGFAEDATPSTPDDTGTSMGPRDSGVHPDAFSPVDVGFDSGVFMDASAPQIMLDWVRSTVPAVNTLYFTRTEITVDQFDACVRAGACPMRTFRTTVDRSYCNMGHMGRLNHPMNCLNFEGAELFCAYVGGRLPTEDEWYAEASSGGTRTYAWGEEPVSCDRAVMFEPPNLGCGRTSTWPVCSKRMGDSISGLCDMIGNVWEWTQLPSGGQGRMRGGAWDEDVESNLRATGSWNYSTSVRNPEQGFRCLRETAP
jgi:formylglycine-generating enzyme